jgi:hypothetical protein
MGLRRAFAGAAIGGFLGSLTNTPALGSVGFTAGLLSGGHGGGERFVNNHPVWANNHPRAAEVLGNSGPFGSMAGERFVQNHPGWAIRHPYAADRMDLGGPSLAGGLYPSAGIAATGGAALGNIFNSMASGIASVFGGGAPAPQMQIQDQPVVSFTNRGPGFTSSGFNSA